MQLRDCSVSIFSSFTQLFEASLHLSLRPDHTEPAQEVCVKGKEKQGVCGCTWLALITSLAGKRLNISLLLKWKCEFGEYSGGRCTWYEHRSLTLNSKLKLPLFTLQFMHINHPSKSVCKDTSGQGNMADVTFGHFLLKLCCVLVALILQTSADQEEAWEPVPNHIKQRNAGKIKVPEIEI